jgi:hypothetical protein
MMMLKNPAHPDILNIVRGKIAQSVYSLRVVGVLRPKEKGNFL